MKKILIFFFYLIFIIYSVEVLLFIFSSDAEKSLVDIKGKRIEIAKKNNLTYDTREPELVFLEKRKNIKDLSSVFYYSPLFEHSVTFSEARKKNELIPFRGPVNKKSLSCSEDLNYRIVENDKYGFKNPNSTYDKKIETILLGDSYAEGFCYLAKDDIAGNLIKKNINTLNLGVASTGPLVSLAIFREFASIYKPKNIIYLYFEGNDLDGLEWEKRDKNLIKYLKKGHNINYIKRLKEINSFLDSAEKESIQYARVKTDNDLFKKKNKFNLYFEHFQDLVELNKTKNILRNIFLSKSTNYDLELLYKIVKEMDNETKSWNGEFTFVYIPTWERYFHKHTNLNAVITLKDEIIFKLQSVNVDVIDLSEFFENSNNLKENYPLGYIGHFSKIGYKNIANVIEKKLKK